MTNPAHNALHDVHLFDHLAEKHRNRVRQAAQQSDTEGAPSMCVMSRSAADAYRTLLLREANRKAAEEIKQQVIDLTTAARAPNVEDAIWHEIPQIMPPADLEDK